MIRDFIKTIIKSIFWRFYANNLRKGIISKMEEKTWRGMGCPVPTPASVKHRLIERYAVESKADILIETGTFMGDTIFALKDKFDKLITIELDRKLAHFARKRFKKYPHIQVIQGDSAQLLREQLNHFSKENKLIFWLDGHYSGSITGKSHKHTPIVEELEAIFTKVPDSCVLIDDARLFNGTYDYPTLEVIRRYIGSISLAKTIYVEDDIICIK